MIVSQCPPIVHVFCTFSASSPLCVFFSGLPFSPPSSVGEGIIIGLFLCFRPSSCVHMSCLFKPSSADKESECFPFSPWKPGRTQAQNAWQSKCRSSYLLVKIINSISNKFYHTTGKLCSPFIPVRNTSIPEKYSVSNSIGEKKKCGLMTLLLHWCKCSLPWPKKSPWKFLSQGTKILRHRMGNNVSEVTQ